MASLNTLTGLLPVIYSAVDTVSREQTGSIMACNRDSTFEQAHKGATVRSPVAPAASASDITPGAYAPDSGGQTIGYVDMSINKFRKVEVQWTGEEQGAVGGNYNAILADQFKQAFRALNNEIASDIVSAAVAGASRAYGNAGTTPFATANDLSDFSAINRILDDNGAPVADRHMILSSAAKQNLYGKHSELFKVNEAGTADLMLNGAVAKVQGLWLGNDRFLSAHTAGTGASYLVNSAHASGATTITVDTGSGTILAGDVVSIGGVMYVVASALSGGSFTIAAPGLQAAVADNAAVTLVSSYTPSFACAPKAIQLAVRAPAMPAGGDSAADVMMVTDPISNLSYQVALYKGYRQVHIEVAAAWGVKVVKPEHVALLLG